MSPAESVPLTGLQKSMVLASLREPRAGVYLIQDVWESPTATNPALLKDAWDSVTARHSALRTAIAVHNDSAVTQRVADRAEISWTEVSGTDLSAFLSADRARGFSFDDRIPMRFALLSERTLVWTCHHALLDGRSLAVVWQELLETAEALRNRRNPDLPPPRSARPPAQPNGAEEYWRAYLGGLDQTTGFVIDRLNGPTADGQDRIRERAQLTSEETRALQAFAENHALTINTLVQAAGALLLSRYSGLTDVVFGVTRSCRAPDDKTVGMLINTLPFRVLVDEDANLLEWLKTIRAQWIAGREYERTPLDQVCRPGTPPFDTVLVYDRESPGDALARAGWPDFRLTRYQRTDSPLALACTGRPLLTLDVAADGRLFSSETIARLTGHLQTLLVKLPAHANDRVSALPMLGAQEQHWLIREVNRTETPYPHNLSMHRLIEQRAGEFAEKPALDGIHGEVSYADLNQRANRLAWYLHASGAKAEDLIAVVLDSSPDLIVAVLAVLKCGAGFLPIDSQTPLPRIVSMIQDAKPRFVLAGPAQAAQLAAGGSTVLVLGDLDDELRRQPDGNLPDIAAPENAAYAIYTSGSTGQPKAAINTHRSLVNYTAAARRSFQITPADRRIHFASPSADIFVAEVFNYLSAGATLVFVPREARSSAIDFLRVVDEFRITITGLPSSWWSELVAAMSAGAAALPRSLRAIIVGMERMNPADLAEWNRVTKGRVRLFNDYGPTEACCTATVYETGTSEWESASLVPIGTPMQNMIVLVLDSRLRPVPLGVAGELYIGGVGVGRGYLNRPELTAERFVRDPFSDDPTARLYKTGDLGFRLPDGNLVFAGRVDRQVKIRGHRVELEEIEAVLAVEPSVLQAAVVFDNRLIAYIVADPARAMAAADLRRRLARHLPDHMIPSAIVPVPAIPRTASGKLDRRALPAAEPEPAAFHEPVSATEKRVATLWCEILGLARVSVTDNFFDLGGDSLRATRLITRVRAEFGLDLPFATLVGKSSVAQLAELIDSSTRAESLLSLNRGNGRPPLFCISSCAVDLGVFRHVAGRLPAEQPLFAIGAPLREDRIQSVEDLAARVCRSLRESGAQPPWRLGGYCFGGVLAFEAARQFLEAGDEVRLVILFDTPTPGYPKLLRFRTNGSPLGRIGVRDVARFVKFAGRLAGRKIAAQTWRTVMAPTLAATGEGPGEIAARMYRPKPLAAPVVHFISGDQFVSTRVLEDPRFGWREVCRAGFRAIRVPGSHANLFDEQYSSDLASRVFEVLAEAQNAATV